MADGRLDGIRLRPARVGAPSETQHSSESELSRRILHEFQELPGTCLTVAQASRLFDIPEDVGQRLLGGLVEEGLLRVTRDGRYRLRSTAA